MFEAEIAKLPAEPPRKPSLLPGLGFRSNFNRGLGFPLVFFALFASMPLFILTSDHNAQLSYRGRTIDATVVSVAETDGSRPTRQITYSFSPNGAAEFRGTCRCAQGSAYYDVKAGDHVPVRFLPADPSVNHLAGGSDSEAPPPFVFLIFPLMGALVFFPVYGPQLKSWYRARQAFKNGVIAKGSLVFVKRGPPSWPNYMQSSSDVHISFRLPTGEMVEGKTTSTNEWLLNHLPPGASVNIAYLPSSPQSIILLDDFVR